MNFLLNLVGKPSAASYTTPIADYFIAQKRFMPFIGVWPTITTNCVWARIVISVGQRLVQLFVNFVMLHLAIMFCYTFYIEIDKSSFARISYLLSQAIIFIFSLFSLFYMQLRTDGIQRMMQHMNDNFLFRSAKGW